MQSTRISTEVMNFYKTVAEDRGITLTELCGLAIKWYIKHTQDRKYHYYLISSSNESYKSLWIETGVLNATQKVAEKDGVSCNNMVFSALVTFFHEARLKDRNADIEELVELNRYI